MVNLQKENTERQSEEAENLDSITSVQGLTTLLFGKQRSLYSFYPSVYQSKIPAKTHVKGGRREGWVFSWMNLLLPFFF